VVYENMVDNVVDENMVDNNNNVDNSKSKEARRSRLARWVYFDPPESNEDVPKKVIC